MLQRQHPQPSCCHQRHVVGRPGPAQHPEQGHLWAQEAGVVGWNKVTQSQLQSAEPMEPEAARLTLAALTTPTA